MIIVTDGDTTNTDRFEAIRFNGDTSSSYNVIYVASNVTSATRLGVTGADFIYTVSGLERAVIQVMDYSATDKHKTMLATSSNNDYIFMYANRWAKTEAVNSVTLLTTDTSFNPTSSFTAGTTFSLFGRVG
jgi:hypothetical protein